MKRIVKYLIPCLVACFMVIGLVQTASVTFATTDENTQEENGLEDNVSSDDVSFYDSEDISGQSDYDYTVNVGETKVIINSNSQMIYSTEDENVVTVNETTNGNNRKYSYSITGKSIGTTTIKIGNVSYTVEVVDADVKVAVYVASYVDAAQTERISDECIELLGIDPDTIDDYGYFPVGVITIKQSYINSKGNSTALITQASDWDILLNSLGNIDTSTLVNQINQQGKLIPYENNKSNVVNQYLSQASKDVGSSGSDQKSALIKVDGGVGYSEIYYYHLDLRFETRKITFITGNNGIDSGNAKDGTKVDSRTYIKGSLIQEPRGLTIPEGYRFEGYFLDSDFTIPWNGIGTPLNEDQTVYIKIVPLKDVLIQYKVAIGEGSVTLDEEHFNPKTGSPEGSTAHPSTDWEFVGWYSAESCADNKLLSNELEYVPEKPSDGWPEGANYIFYAKFQRAVQTITVKKDVSGNFGNHDETFNFSYSYMDGNDEIKGTFALKDLDANGRDDEGIKIANIPIGIQLTITESNVAGYETTASYTGSNDKKSENISVTGTKESSTKTIQVKIDKDCNLITITNTKDAVPLTGIIDNTPKGLGMIGTIVAEVVAIAFVLKKKKQLKM